MESNQTSVSFVALFLSTNIKSASLLITKLFERIPFLLSSADLDKVASAKPVSALTSFLLVFSNCNSWTLVKQNEAVLPILNSLCSKISSPIATSENFILLAGVLNKLVCRNKTLVNLDVVNGLMTVLLRVLKYQSFSTLLIDNTIRHLLTCPALITHLSSSTLQLLKSDDIFQKIVSRLATHQNVADNLSCIESINLLANFVNLSYISHDVLIENLLEWTSFINVLFNKCLQSTMQGKKKPHWHAILGWTAERVDQRIEATTSSVLNQLSFLWSKKLITSLFGKVLSSVENVKKKKPITDDSLSLDLIQKLMKKLPLREQYTYNTNIPPVSLTAVVCQLYQNALLTFPNIHADILSALCRDDSILIQLWLFVESDNGGLQTFLSYIKADPSASLPHFAPLSLFADIAYSLISILDEKEMYENGSPFSITQLCSIAKFVNIFCFKAIWEKLIDFSNERAQALFNSVYQLCMILHNRDSRRPFTSSHNFWHAPDVKSSTIMAEFEKSTSRAQLLMQRMPHLLPLKERMIFFRKLVAADKDLVDIPSTLVTIERARIVEDGYRQLSTLPSQALKATIRVKFINQQGLDEAGIDQDGVFKEFLELTIKKVFDPELNLFRSTSNQQLYPSNTSYVHENHLQLFEFVGRILAKAVYESIVVDVQLAPVLSATVLGKQLCPFDELSSLDPELYKNLTYVKHYKDSEDVADLELTFSYNEEFLGKVKTIDLVPGGRAIKVTNENKILYIHKMAQYRVIRQTKEQCEHFVAGFRSIIHSKWLTLFDTHELQYLISGMRSDIDLADLKRNVQYYGGFHGNHRLIKWLWQILESDFTVEERHLFLKFVTSCSRAPLLGFAYLEPPFSIRCVEVSDDQDQGDTLGSVIRGFLAIKRKPTSRLPTASTCFNLLKLPNYSKKSTLLEKLRYAIHSETGFELS
uniref:Ubiquitin-protein ligase E3B n=1 Tax=Acrobeloides nanus TaxID=290746 RepID=A0A914EGA9_9BILA